MKHMNVTVNHNRNMTLQRAPGKITHIEEHLIPFSDENSATMLLKGPRNGFCRK